MRGPWTRPALALLTALAAPGLAPFSAAAQVVSRSAGAGAASSARVSVAPLGPSISVLAPTAALLPLSAPALVAVPVAAAPVVPAAVAPVPAAARPAAAPALKAAAAQVALDAPALGRAPTEGASAAGERQFRLLTGEAFSVPSSVAAADGPADPRPSGLSPAPKPSTLDPVRRRGVRTMIAGTAAMKLGMETVTLSVPMLVLQGMGGAALVATLMVGYGVAQAVFSGASGGLIDRSSPQKVLAGAVAAQALLVAGVIALGATGMLSVPLLAASYVLIGGAVGIMETARQSIPARLLGQDEAELSRYNARLHIFYEVSGVAGPLAAGALMAAFGPLWALLIQPPAYLAAAWLFSRVRLPAGPARAALAASRPASVVERAKEYVADVKAGARVVLGDARLRWVALAFVVPQILHRLLEGLILPVFAKRVLGAPGDAAYLLTASNLGELVGAVLLLKLAEKIPAPTWVKRGAAALAVFATLAFTHALWLALPAVFLMSATWSSSDLALRSDVQSHLGERDLPRATAFLYGAFVLGAAAASLGLGFLFDALAPGAALAWTAAAFAAAGAAVWAAARHFASRRSKDSIESSKR